MNKVLIQPNQIDINFPVELIPFQYDIDCSLFLTYVADIESILLRDEQAKLFLNWLFEGPTANYWLQYISDGEQCYVDLNTGKSPYCIMMPLVVFRYHFCQWSKGHATPKIFSLLDRLFNETKYWRKAQADMIAINFYLVD